MNDKKGVFLLRHAALLMLMAVLVHPVSLVAQVPVPVEISTEKIVSEGKVYYMHYVEKGQTLYSIARAYTVNVDLLTRENGIADNCIREGQMLRIPAAAVAQGQAAMKNSQGYVQGNATGKVPVQAGGQTGGQANAGKSAATTAGTVTRPASAVNNQDDRYIYHRVRRGETLGTIANDYGISVRDLKRANRGLLFPHEGDNLLIPKNKISQRLQEQRVEEPAGEIAADTITADTLANEEFSERFTVPGERTVIESLHGSVRVAVLFPFFIKENNTRLFSDSTGTGSQGNRVSQDVNRSAGRIYDGSIPFLETYEGILVAVDSLRSLGLAVELNVFDTGSDSLTLNRLLVSGVLNSADLIIGPVFSSHLGQIAQWATDRNIPFVSPVPLRDKNISENKPTMYRVVPSESVIRDIMATELKDHPDSRVIFLHSDSSMYDPATSALWRRIAETAGDTSYPGNGRLIAHHFTGVTSKRNVYSSVTELENLLDPGRENIIVLATTQTPIISAAFSALHGLTKRYNIKVMGYPDIRGLETIDLKYFYDLELLIPTESYVDFESPAAQAFSAVFMKKFRTEPMAESFAWRGFDIAYYFIGGLAAGGKDFLRDPGTFNPALLCLEPDFRRDSRQNGYENRGVFMLHYRRDMTIEIKRPSPVTVIEDQKFPGQSGFIFSDSSGRNRVR